MVQVTAFGPGTAAMEPLLRVIVLVPTKAVSVGVEVAWQVVAGSA